MSNQDRREKSQRWSRGQSNRGSNSRRFNNEGGRNQSNRGAYAQPGPSRDRGQPNQRAYDQPEPSRGRGQSGPSQPVYYQQNNPQAGYYQPNNPQAGYFQQGHSQPGPSRGYSQPGPSSSYRQDQNIEPKVSRAPNQLQIPESQKPFDPKDRDSYKYVVLEATDGERYAMQKQAVTLSFNLSYMLDQIHEGMQCEVDHNCPVIPLIHSSCTAVTVQRIISFCEYHMNDPYVKENIVIDFEDDDYDKHLNKLREVPSFWDRRFIETGDLGQFYDLMIAAHYLQIDSLVELGAKHICCLIGNKNIEEVRLMLNIQNDFHPREEETIRRMNAWAFS